MAKKIDFIQIIDFIFKNKNDYKKIDDIDKEENFFIINRKFSLKYPLHANLFNNKFIDKASALDFWHVYFSKTKGIPGWYWSKSKKEKEKKLFSGPERKLLMQYHEISEKDLDFLIKNNIDEVKEELKKIKRFKSE